MHIAPTTAQYEAWLGRHLRIIGVDLQLKHQQMRSAVFPFLRATYYRWAETWAGICGASAAAPEVLGVGDLHVENFGTWRDIEGRLIWGINDFDEACRLPYTVDLVRLAASAHFAINEGHLHLLKRGASKAILDGYFAGLKAGGRPFALAEHHPALREAAVDRLKNPETFWKKLNSFRELRTKPPSSALKGLLKMMP